MNNHWEESTSTDNWQKKEKGRIKDKRREYSRLTEDHRWKQDPDQALNTRRYQKSLSEQFMGDVFSNQEYQIAIPNLIGMHFSRGIHTLSQSSAGQGRGVEIDWETRKGAREPSDYQELDQAVVAGTFKVDSLKIMYGAQNQVERIRFDAIQDNLSVEIFIDGLALVHLEALMKQLRSVHQEDSNHNPSQESKRPPSETLTVSDQQIQAVLPLVLCNYLLKENGTQFDAGIYMHVNNPVLSVADQNEASYQNRYPANPFLDRIRRGQFTVTEVTVFRHKNHISQILCNLRSNESYLGVRIDYVAVAEIMEAIELLTTQPEFFAQKLTEVKKQLENK